MILLLLSFWATLYPTTRADTLVFERTNLTNTLHSNSTLELLRDNHGFLWIGTQNGLGRYAGGEVKPYRRNRESKFGLSDGYITALLAEQDALGSLWVGTESGGLHYIDPVTHQVTVFAADTSKTTTLKSDYITDLATDSNKDLWIATSDKGLYQFSKHTQEFKQYSLSSSTQNSILSDSINVLLASKIASDELWIGTDAGLSILHVEEGLIENYAFRGESSKSSNVVNSIFETAGSTWCITQDGMIHRFERQTRSFISEENSLLKSASSFVTTPSQKWPYLLWVGTNQRGLYSLNLFSNKHTSHPVSPNIQGQPEKKFESIHSISEDQYGLLWVGTLNGVYRALLNKTFQTEGAPNKNRILSLYQPPNNTDELWVGEFSGGLTKMLRDTTAASISFTPVKTYFGDKTANSRNRLSVVFGIHKERPNLLWLGASNGALYEFNPITGDTTSHLLEPDGKLSANDRPTYRIYAAPSNPDILWLSTEQMGLIAFDTRKREVVHRFKEDLLNTNTVWAVLEDPSDASFLWVATHNGGLHKLNVNERSTTSFSPENGGCIPSDRIVTLLEGPGNSLWLGTFDHGLIQLNLNDFSCKIVSSDVGNPHGDVSNILRDEKGYLWLTTNRGLSRYDQNKQAMTTFDASDGLQDNLFGYLAAFSNVSREMYVGGPGGYNAFMPLSIFVDTTAADTRLIDMEVNNTPYPFREAFDKGEKILLNRNENKIKFEFASFDFRRPEKIRYKILLLSDEENEESINELSWQWLEAGKNSWEYPRLAPGHYTFLVHGTNSYGYLKKEPASLSFYIAPPLLQRWWFLSSLALGLLFVTSGIYQLRLYDQTNLTSSLRNIIARDLHDDMGGKITNMAIKIDNSGNAAGVTDHMKKTLQSLAAEERLLVEDLRDVVWFVDAGYDSLPKLIDHMKMEAYQALMSKKYSFELFKNIPDLPLGMDQRKNLFLLFKEALRNIVQHASADRVNIKIDILEDTIFHLEITDNGLGFDSKKITAGHGLKSIHKRAEDINGQLELTSILGQGTTLKLKHNLRQRALSSRVITRWRRSKSLF